MTGWCGVGIGVRLPRNPSVAARSDVKAAKKSKDVGSGVEVIVCRLVVGRDQQRAGDTDREGQALADETNHEEGKHEPEDHACNFHIHQVYHDERSFLVFREGNRRLMRSLDWSPRRLGDG